MVRVWSRKLETCQLSATNVDYNFGGKNLCVSDKNSDIFYSANVKASGGGGVNNWVHHNLSFSQKFY